MEQLPDNNAAQGNRAAPRPSLGKMLREAREHMGLSVADVAAQIKFAPRQIEALEADDFDSLPEAAFLRGFVRSYAKILQIDAQLFLAAMPQVKAPAAELVPASVEVPFPATLSPQRQTMIMLGAALLVGLVVIGFTVWNHYSKIPGAKIEVPVTLPAETRMQPEPPVQQTEVDDPVKPELAQPKPRVAAIEKPVVVHANRTVIVSGVPQTPVAVRDDADAEARTSSLRLVFDEESWTEIKDRDGVMISSQINPRGSELHVDGHLPVTLVIGHAATTHLYQDGEPVDLAPFINSSSVVARITLE